MHAHVLPADLALSLDFDADALLAADPDFAAVCDARRDGWVAAHDADQEEGERVAHGCDDHEPEDGDELTCPDCNGTGEGAYGLRCGVCRGNGYSVYRTPDDE